MGKIIGRQGNHRPTITRPRWINLLLWILIWALLAWAFIPGLGPDLAGLGKRGWPEISFNWRGWGNAPVDLSRAPNTELFRALKQLPLRPDSNRNSGADTNSRNRYSRTSFGPAWADTDHNGCDTRNDILARDLSAVTFKPGTNNCQVASGVLADPYTGRNIIFTRSADTSKLVQIDHIVPLADAWDSGARQWSSSQRLQFANDPFNLVAVDGRANQEKGRQHAGQWLPPNRAYHCQYGAQQIAVKAKYDLSVTNSERNALARLAYACQSQPLPQR